MRARRGWVVALAIGAATGAVACTGRSGPTEPARLAATVWGAAGANLTVAPDHALLELACAQGTIPGPLVVGPGGTIQAEGTFGRVGGAAPPDGIFPSHPALYSGRVDGDVLALSIHVPATSQDLGPFLLRKGERGRIVLCP